MQAESQKINILMVDDSPTNLLALEAILQAPERNLVRAASGDEALRYLLDTDVAVILLDVYMPGIDGLETAALIRGREKSRDIPIIFLTADSTGNRHIARGYSLGAVDYILKPVDPDILRSKVAVFVELFKKTEEIKRQAALLHDKNIELENANLQRLGKLIDLGQELAAERDPQQVLEKFCRAARDIVGAEHAGVGVLEDSGRALRYYCHCEVCEWDDGRGRSPLVSESVLAQLLADARPLRLSEAAGTLEAAHLTAPRVSMESFLGAPILTGAHAHGWLYLSNKLDADEFSEADERLAVTLATQVASAYENARLYTEAQRHAAELQQEVAERKLAEEARARLLVREQAARAEAERANRTKDEFLATLSHELRTPLTAILGWTHLIRGGNLDEAMMARALETIERNARAQSQLIDDLLDVSRIITGKLSLDFRPVELASIIEATIDTVRPMAEAKSIRVHPHMRTAHCVVSGDPARLQQVVWNLFSNAVKFTPEGGRVEVKLFCDERHVELEVSDTGQGISPDFLPYIFDRFRQADGTTTRKHGGLGLGLAIVRHLVELHGGTIRAHSDGDGRGSTFTLSLPLAAAIDVEDDGAAESIEEQPVASANGNASVSLARTEMLGGLRILVVDDEADTRELVQEVLARQGAQVRVSESAAEALRVLAAWKPDLLISDIGMPVEDGYELIKQVRRFDAEHQGHIPAVALTAYAGADDHRRALAAGFQTHLAKPIEPKALIETVARVTGRAAPIDV
ncbi:MAG TPA: response regulator [Pyrinomonadaceae bacterium]|jgi:signal transduction histidine kinase/response regulator RpfG family c-di-GMP phosphodiesterase